MSSGPTFGTLLKKHRTDADLTQDQLATLAGISQSTLSEYERDEAEPLLSNFIRLGDALGLSLDELARPLRPKSRRRPQLLEAAS